MSHLTPPKTSLKALARLAGPIFVANISIIGSGTIDTIMAGQLGKDHLAAIALGLAATVSVVMGLVGILQSLSPIAGHHYGARRYRAIGEELQQNIWLGIFLSFIGVPLLLYSDLWISMGQVTGDRDGRDLSLFHGLESSCKPLCTYLCIGQRRALSSSHHNVGVTRVTCL